MAKHLVDQPQINLNGYEVGADVFNFSVFVGRRAPVDVTGLSNTYDEFLVPNLRGWGVKLDYFNNLTGTSVTPTGITTVLKGVFDSTATTGVTLTIRNTTGARSVSNNEWTGQVQLDGQFQGVQGGVAEADKGSVTFKGLGVLSWLTSSS
jgi:hypothetical protein